jgi:cytochrome c oxidase subunit 3
VSKDLKIKQMGGSPQLSEWKLKYHPVRIITLFTLAGISFAFITLTVGYFLTTLGTEYNKFKLPAIFHANTIIILVSSYSMWQVRKHLEAADWKGFLSSLAVSIGLGIAFTAFQIIGWRELLSDGVRLSQIGGAWLYVISGLHLAHLVVGLGVMGWYALKAIELNADPVKALIFETTPDHTMKAEMMCLYWHFVDGMWIYIYLFFLLNIYVLTSVKLPF